MYPDGNKIVPNVIWKRMWVTLLLMKKVRNSVENQVLGKKCGCCCWRAIDEKESRNVLRIGFWDEKK